MLPMIVALTLLVVTVKLVEAFPAAIVTEVGTVAAGFALAKLTTALPTGAGAVKVTVPLVDCPPVTVEGFNPIEANAGVVEVDGL